MYRSMMVVAVTVVAVSLQGCVIAIGDGVARSERGQAGWQTQQEHNRAFIHSLGMGVPIESVQAYLGEPDFSEAFHRDDGEYRVLFYRTHHVRSDGKTTRDETTPVVFREGEVIGFGEDFYRRLMN